MAIVIVIGLESVGRGAEGGRMGGGENQSGLIDARLIQKIQSQDKPKLVTSVS